jgi:tellurite resistance protein
VTVSLLLLSVTTLHLAPAVSRVLWVAGASLHLAYTLYALSTWIHKSDVDIRHISPAWFIPVVGNILVPVAGVTHAGPDINWFFLSIGLLFWVVLFTIIVYRVIFHHPLPDRLLPTLFIMIAPPAVGFISYVKLTGNLDGFGRLLYFNALFLTLLLFLQLPRFLRLPFYLSWWAYSFPLAAMAVATLLMQELAQLPVYTFLAWMFLGILYAVVIYLVARTLYAVAHHQICVEQH